jgi:hypothetical protein
VHPLISACGPQHVDAGFPARHERTVIVHWQIAEVIIIIIYLTPMGLYSPALAGMRYLYLWLANVHTRACWVRAVYRSFYVKIISI